ncbi:hypothetical protein FB451DRAFT_1230146 [Mycena latifolia]|nr:hypothetical protein FB451DRAFT_1230146 [Mycena latifolia]
MNNSAALIDMAVVAAGPTRLAAYIEQKFTPEEIQRGQYTIQNTANWLDVDDFTRWLNPPTPLAYVLGFGLTPSQMRTVARTLLESEPETLAQCKDDHDYHSQLVAYAHAKNEKWAFLQTIDDESKEVHYLWVLYVVLSWDGGPPQCVMPDGTIRRVKDAFKFDKVKILCQRWPQGVTPPKWLVSCLQKTIQESKL